MELPNIDRQLFNNFVLYLDDALLDTGATNNTITPNNPSGISWATADRLVYLAALRIFEDFPYLSVEEKVNRVAIQVRDAGYTQYQPSLYLDQLRTIFNSALTQAYVTVFGLIQ